MSAFHFSSILILQCLTYLAIDFHSHASKSLLCEYLSYFEVMLPPHGKLTRLNILMTNMPPPRGVLFVCF